MTLPPLPPEPDWAPPPRRQTGPRPPAAPDARTDPALRPAVVTARWAGVVGLIALCSGAVPEGPIVRAAVLLVGAVIAGALGWRARRDGLPTADVIGVAVTTFALTAVISVGVVLTVAFGACLIALRS